VLSWGWRGELNRIEYWSVLCVIGMRDIVREVTGKKVVVTRVLFTGCI
jgi:hypothetical protein